MSSIDGKYEMVGKYSLFDNETYDNLYKIFRGHIRFYSYYWESRQRLSHEDIIHKLMAENQLILSSCLISIDSENEQRKIHYFQKN